MEIEQYRSSMIAFICSVAPVWIAVCFVGFVYHFSPRSIRPGSWGQFDALGLAPAVIFVLCVGFLIVLVTIGLGAYSVRLGIDAIREFEARGKPLAVVAIVLGISEIVAVTGAWFWYASVVF
ncbi:MAG: hypothetical protein JSU70_09565 [Phycisphaerales bacterium]|nr:MAG: hypothetical protein JSU70_09565 [Phycisphaerales bacterium]